MMHPRVRKLSDREIDELDISTWPITTQEVSRSSRQFDRTEEYLVLQGQVELETDNGPIRFGAGDYVTFPEGTVCIWDIKEPLVAHYNREGLL